MSVLFWLSPVRSSGSSYARVSPATSDWHSEPGVCGRFSAGPSSWTCNEPRRRRARSAQRHQMRQRRNRRARGNHNPVRTTGEGRGPPATARMNFGGQGELSDPAPFAPELSVAGYCGIPSNQAGKRKVSLPRHQSDALLFAAEGSARRSLRLLRPCGENAFFASPHSQTETEVVEPVRQHRPRRASHVSVWNPLCSPCLDSDRSFFHEPRGGVYSGLLPRESWTLPSIGPGKWIFAKPKTALRIRTPFAKMAPTGIHGGGKECR